MRERERERERERDRGIERVRDRVEEGVDVRKNIEQLKCNQETKCFRCVVRRSLTV